MLAGRLHLVLGLSACPLNVQAEHAQAELSGQLRQAQRNLQEAEEKLQACQESLAFVAAEKKELSRHCSELEPRLNRLQQVGPASHSPSALALLHSTRLL